MTDERSKAREGLDCLLELYPFADIALMLTQRREIVDALTAAEKRDLFGLRFQLLSGSWTYADLWEDGELKRFAIWNTTGDVYKVGEDGAVGVDPFIEVTLR